jgi:hypothetical protein
MTIDKITYKRCNNETILTANGDGKATLIGNMRVSESDNIKGDNQVGGDSHIDGNSIVDGDVTMVGNVVGNNNMYVPTINATNIYQPVNIGESSVTDSLILDSFKTGTVYFINPSTVVIVPFTYVLPNNPRVGTNYKFIINGNIPSTYNITFTGSQQIVGTYYYSVPSITGSILNPHPQSILNPSGTSSYYKIKDSSIPLSYSVGRFTFSHSVNTGALGFTASHLSVGDNLTFIYTGSTWMVLGYINTP